MNDDVQKDAQEQLQDILALKTSGDLSAAAEQIATLNGVYPSFCPGWLERGRLYRIIGDRAQSLQAFQTVAKLEPGCVSHLEVALEQIQLGQFE
ncbi:hypothetical protein, partial [Okeania sp. SIO2G5]|uniref:hypothetical protein n=1 Tax=Okeania sp. SIO2G5 TaxID=2607796 RepID=UPI0013C21E64